MHSRHDSDRNQYNPQAYLDGIPVKIGERFRPPRRVVLPLNFVQRNPSEALTEDYNFSLERRVLEWAEKQRIAKEANAKAQVEKVAQQIEQFTRTNQGPNNGSGEDSPPPSASQPSSSTDSNHEGGDGLGTDLSNDASSASVVSSALLANFETREILKPVLFNTPPNTSHHSKYQLASERMTNNFKLEDFEAESSPFDSMELKTLNDMEELKSVLQSMGSSQSEKAENSNPTKSDGKPLLNGTIQYYPGGGSHINGVIPNNLPSSYLSSSYPQPDPRQQNPQRPYPGYPPQQFPPQNTPFQSQSAQPSSYTKSGPTYTTYLSTSTSTTGAPWVTEKLSQSYYTPSDSFANPLGFRDDPYSSLYYPGEIQNQSHTPGSESSSSSNSSLRNAQSTPDLLKELGKGATDGVLEKKRHSHSYPPRPNSVGSVEEAAANASYHEKVKHQHLLEHHRDLGEAERKVVLQMVDMGFSRLRVERAVLRLGTDDKKIIEHLCSVQALTEKGFDAEKVEYALSLHNGDELVAHEYLQLTKQFLDLGFDEEAIRKALELHKNDRDKALDYLVS